MAVQTAQTLKNKRIKLLDGTRAKIIGVLSTNYKLDDGSKISARKVLQKGKGYVETDLTMRDLEDTGMGFVALPEVEEKPKSKTKSKTKTKPKSKTKSKTKTKPKAAEAETKGRKKKTKTKPKAEEADKPKTKTKSKTKTKPKAEEAETKGRKKRTKKSKTSSGTKQSESSTVSETKVKRSLLDFATKTQIDKIRQFVSSELREHLVTYHSNIENIISEASIFQDDEDRAEIRLQVLVKVPRPEHHSLDFYLAIAKEQGANLKTPSEKLQQKMRERLDLEDADEPVEISVGSILDDEQGKRYVFAGILDKKFAFIDIENEQVVTGAYTFFEGLDYISNFASVMGEGMEEFDQRTTKLDSADPDLDDDLDMEDLEPLSSIEDWTTVDRDSMVDMIVGNYSREDIIAFIDQHEDLELEEDEYDLETNVIVGMMVDGLREDPEEFEEDAVDGEEQELTLDAMLKVLIDNQLVPAALAKHLTQEQVEAMYADIEQDGDSVDLEEADSIEDLEEDEDEDGDIEDLEEDEDEDGDIEDLEEDEDEDLEEDEVEAEEEADRESKVEKLAALGIRGITPRVLAAMDDDTLDELLEEYADDLDSEDEVEDEDEVEGDEIIEDEDDVDFELGDD